MRKRKTIARMLAALLCICLVVQNVPLNALASETANEQMKELQTEELQTSQTVESEKDEREEQPEETTSETISEKPEEESHYEEKMSDSVIEETLEDSQSSTQISSEEHSMTEFTTEESEINCETESMSEDESGTEMDNTSSETVSRIEWLRELISAFELDLEKENYPDNYFSDIDSKSEYYHDIMVATGYGLVDVDAGEAFCPNDTATREFAAYSMNMRVGYVKESDSYTFSEAGEVTHADDIQAAIDNGWMALNGSDFLPNDPLTTDIQDAMIKEAKEIHASRKIDENHDNQYEFTDGVIIIPDDTLIELSAENELTITDCPKAISQGDIFAVFDLGMPLVYRAEKVRKSGNQTIISIGDVDMEDAFETFDMEGVIDTDLTSVFVEEDDETVQLNYIVGGSAEKQYEDGEKYESLEELGNREVSAVQVIQEFDYEEIDNGKWFEKPKKETEYGAEDDIHKFTITQTISNIKVVHKNTFSTAYFVVTGNISVSCSLKLDLLDAYIPDLKIVKVQITPIACSLDLDAIVSLEGKVTLDYDGYFEVGVDFEHGRGFRLVSHVSTQSFSTTTEAEAKVGLRASINANYAFIKGSLYAQIGMKGGIKTIDKEDNGEPKKCVSKYAYLYADCGCYVKLLIRSDKNKKWSWNAEIYNIDNSPIKISYHYENGVLVSKCTRNRSSGASGSWGPMWFYNTQGDSRYGYHGGSTGFGANGEPFTIFEYSLNEDNEATITKYNGNVSALSIPTELDGYKVVGIGNNVFKGKTALRTVVIPDSVESIGVSAFEDCSSLTNVQLPENEKFNILSSGGFRNCKKLKRIEIPNTVTEIGSQIFYGCEKLVDVDLPNKLITINWGVFTNVPITKITIPKSLKNVYYGGPFDGCNTLKEITFEEGITAIPNSLFEDCGGLEEIEIPDTVTSIGSGSFRNCKNLEKVSIPNSVTEIGSQIFYGCEKLVDVDLPNKLVTINWGVFTDVPITKITIPKSLKNVYYGGPFDGCNTLKEITFEEGITAIPNSLFEDCRGLEEIEIPDTVTSIGSGSFRNCKNLEKVSIPNSVTEIGSQIFYGCEKLVDVDLPNKLVTINWGVFTDVPITKITIPKSLKNVYYGGPFDGCNTLKEITFEEGITAIPNSLFEDCGGLEEIEIPDTVTSIGSGSFRNCKNLEKVSISNSVIEIGNQIFYGCEKLLEINIPDSVTKMGEGTFSDCISLKNAKLSNATVSINDRMFQNCTSLTTIDLPKTVTSIRLSAFQNSGLTELTLPKNVTTIESSAFDGCTNLAKVTLNTNLKNIGSYSFRNNDALTEITIPNSVTTIGEYVFQDSDALTTATISDSVTSIGQYIFAHCDSLKDVKLGTGLTKIPAYAFNLCPALEKIVLPYRITTVDANAFTNCTKLTEATIPRGTTSISTSAFSYPDRLTVYGISGTYAETYANQIGATFVNREVNATDVTLSRTTLSMITGAKHTLVMSVTPSDFTDEVVWKSSDTNILTVDSMGVITAKAVGTANVRVAVGEKTASCAVTVVQPVTSIRLSRSSLSLAAFEDYTLTATVYPDNAADKSVEWATSDANIATVSQTGKITPLSKGTATITVTAKDGSGRYAQCTITVTSEGQLCTQYSQLESPHNYANNTNKVWKYVYSGAKTLEITFDGKTNVDDGFDFIYIYDKDNKEIKKATGTELANQTIQITGDTVKIKLVSDEAITAWGFKVTKISADGKTIDPSEEKPEEPETSGEESSDTETSGEESSEEDSSGEESSEEDSSEESSKEESSTEENSTEKESEPNEEIKDGLCITGLKTQTYTGSAIKQDIKVYYNKHLLQEGADYTLSYKNNKDVGQASVTVKSKNNLTGSVTKTFAIQPRKINDTNVIIEDTVFNYDKKPHKKTPVIFYNGKVLKEGKDYKVTDYGLGDYTSVGTYTIKIEGIGNFTGTFDDAKVIIADKDHNLSKAKIAKIPIQEYQNGAKVELPNQLIQVTLNKTTLKKDIDYTVSYANNTDAGKATLIIRGKGSYAGTKKANFTIKRTPIELSDSMVVNKSSINSVAIQKNGAMPKPKLTWNGYILTEGKDYTLSYKNHKKTGTGMITIKGKGSYTGQLDIPYRITEKDLTDTDITIRVPDVPYTGKPNKYQSNPVIADIDGGILVKNKDYAIETYAAGNTTLDKKSNPEEGTVITVTIKGKGSYTGTVKATYTLQGISFSQAAIKIKPKLYTGNPVTIESTDIISASIKIGKVQNALQLGKDYEIAAYSNNLKKGTATVTFRGIGNYAGEKTVKFKINSARIE